MKPLTVKKHRYGYTKSPAERALERKCAAGAVEVELRLQLTEDHIITYTKAFTPAEMRTCTNETLKHSLLDSFDRALREYRVGVRYADQK